MGLCNFFAFICCPRRYHINNVLNKSRQNEVGMLVDEYEALYKETSRLVEVSIDEAIPVKPTPVDV